MKIFTLALLFCGLCCSAQNHRFVYEYSYIKDSLDRSKVITENMTLDISPEGSKYYSVELAQSDSIMQAELMKQLKMGSTNIKLQTPRSMATVRGVVTKIYPDFKVQQEESLGSSRFIVEDQRKPMWKILPEKQQVGTFTAQKATTELYGRKWTAWFASELPFQDGPYKFYGLPGLIVKLEDDTKSHVMELKAVKKLPQSVEPEVKSGREKITLNYEKYKKAFLEYRENPSKNLRQMAGSSGGAVTTAVFSTSDGSGKAMDLNEMSRSMDEKAKERNKHDNNLLELDLLK